jgi:hypothetical protein
VATYEVASKKIGAYKKTLVANTVDTVEFADYLQTVRIVSHDGAAEIYYTIDGSTPAVGGEGTHEIPAYPLAEEIDIPELVRTAPCRGQADLLGGHDVQRQKGEGVMSGALIPLGLGNKPGSGLSIGAAGEAGKVLDAAQTMYLWPTDSRIANPIDLTGATYSDTGYEELLALAAPNKLTILLPDGSIIKCQKGKAIPAGVQHVAAGSGSAARIEFPTDLGNPAYALISSALAQNAATIPLKYVTGGPFKAATAESPQEAFLSGIGKITYTGITGAGETITLTGVTGVTKAAPVPAGVGQGLAIYAVGVSSPRFTVFERGIEIKGPTSGTFATWGKEAPPESMDGVWLGQSVRINCVVKGFRHASVITTDHQIIGSDYKTSKCYSSLAFLGPSESKGDQVIEAGALLTEGFWSGIYVADGNAMTNLGAAKMHIGSSPWGVWKEATRGLAAPEQSFPYITAVTSTFQLPSFEYCGLGAIGCADGKSKLQGLVMTQPSFSWLATFKPAGLEPVAPIACQVEEMEVLGRFGFLPFATGQQQMILADKFTKSTIPSFADVIAVAAEKGIPVIKGKTGEEVEADIRFKQGRYYGRKLGDAGIKAGHVVSSVGLPSLKKLKRYEGLVAVAGVAITDIFQNALAFLTNDTEPATVAVKEQSTPPTSPAAAPNATAGTLEARKYFYKVAAVLSGGGVVAASAEVSATAEAGKSIKITWAPLAEFPHGQTITNYRVYRGTAEGAEAGYKQVGNVLELLDNGVSLTGGTAPPTINVGCELYGENLVRPYGAGAPGCACVASGPADPNGPCFGQTVGEGDNGKTGAILISPARR